MERFGTTAEERDAREMLRCRQISAEIMNFGVSQREILRIMRLLALELEDRGLMSSLSEQLRAAIEDDRSVPLSGLITET